MVNLAHLLRGPVALSVAQEIGESQSYPYGSKCVFSDIDCIIKLLLVGCAITYCCNLLISPLPSESLFRATPRSRRVRVDLPPNPGESGVFLSRDLDIFSIRWQLKCDLYYFVI